MSYNYTYRVSMHITTLIIVILFLAFAGNAQKRATRKVAVPKAPACTLTKAPSLRSFFLGQTVSQIEELIPGFATEYQKWKSKQGYDSLFSTTDYNREFDIENRVLGVVTDSVSVDQVTGAVSFYYEDTAIKTIFRGDSEGMGQVSWRFHNDKLYAYTIFYEDYTPGAVKDFIKQISEKTSLPRTGWVLTDKSDIGAMLACSGFKVNLSTAYRDRSRITITDTIIENALIKQINDIKLEKRRDEQERIREENRKSQILKP